MMKRVDMLGLADWVKIGSMVFRIRSIEREEGTIIVLRLEAVETPYLENTLRLPSSVKIGVDQ